ncbi:MAG: PAS domain S-box protein [Gemmatimonadetes bacterium]|nr:MAG: PAS domain S-box protein [Gemmatimonadota bacterium]
MVFRWDSGKEFKVSSTAVVHGSPQFYERLINTIHEGVFVVQEGRVIYVNPSFATLLGGSPEDYIGRGMTDSIAPAYIDLILERNRRRLAGEDVPDEYEIEMLHQDGRSIPVYLRAELIELDGIPATIGTVVDISAQKRYEAELRENMNVIQRQQSALMELSTPVIQIWDGVLVLPVVGTIDSRRAAQIMENVLTKIVETASEHLIIDITGVVVVDTEVANYLIKTVEATRLLGTDCMLVGLSPVVAQTLVQIGVDLSNVKTYASLQKGLQSILALKDTV